MTATEQAVALLSLFIAQLFVQGWRAWKSGKTTKAVHADLNTHRTDIQRLRDDLNLERKRRRRTENQRDELQRKVQGLQERVEALVTIGSRQEDQIRAAQLENASMKGRLEEQREIYTTQIKELQRQVNEFQSALTTSKIREGDAQREVNHLTTQVTALEGKVERLQAEKIARALTGAVKPAEKLPVATPAPKLPNGRAKKVKAMA